MRKYYLIRAKKSEDIHVCVTSNVTTIKTRVTCVTLGNHYQRTDMKSIFFFS